MLKRIALMESISSNLHGFLKKIANNLSVPDKKFLRDSFIGLLRSGKPIVCQMARHLPNQHITFLSRLDRLEAHLAKDSDFDNKTKAGLPDIWLPFIKEDTPIILDLSDIAKPLAKKMDYLATVRDGSAIRDSPKFSINYKAVTGCKSASFRPIWQNRTDPLGNRRCPAGRQYLWRSPDCGRGHTDNWVRQR
jgi:hypothetical protein